MKKSVLTLSLSLALGLSLSSAQTSFAASETGTRFPAPSTVSAEMAESVAAPAPELWLTKEKSPESVSALAQNYAEGAGSAALALAKEYGVDVKLSEEMMKKLDEIFPGPGGEAPEAYAW